MIHSKDGATPLLSPALRYLPSHSSSYRTIPSVPLPTRLCCATHDAGHQQLAYCEHWSYGAYQITGISAQPAQYRFDVNCIITNHSAD